MVVKSEADPNYQSRGGSSPVISLANEFAALSRQPNSKDAAALIDGVKFGKLLKSPQGSYAAVYYELKVKKRSQQPRPPFLRKHTVL